MTAAILDHLWQSTLVGLVLALLAGTVFRKASGAVRYGLWFAASAKFLVPFAVLAMLGAGLAPAIHVPARAAPEAAFIETAARPFSQGPLSQLPEPALGQPPLAPAPLATSPAVHAAPRLNLALILLAAWTLGSAFVLIRWAVRWSRVRKALRSATPLAWPAPMPVMASSTMLEPGLIGLVRPVLLVPESLPEHLGQVGVAAIVAHEAAHLRRRDNVTAAIHMLVEALFWFHPMVWWIGGWLITEREQACDEAVVRSGHDRSAYARSLLESARLYLQSPLDCVAGASGSSLKTRVEAIMTAPLSSPLSRSKKALLLAAGLGAVATPVMAGLIVSPQTRQAVVHAAAVAASALSAPATFAAQNNDAAKPVVLARNEAVLAPTLSVAALDVPATPLARDITPPSVEAPPPAVAPRQAQLAVATPPAPRPSAVAAPPTDPAEIKRQAAEFVRSYGAFTLGAFARSNLTGRWGGNICVEVAGLAPEQDLAVRTRVAEVAGDLGLDVAAASAPGSETPSNVGVHGGPGISHLGPRDAECRSNLQIAFTNDPQGELDRLVKKTDRVLGDPTSDTRKIRTVTRPIQAWYVTNGATYAENGATTGPKTGPKTGQEGLKVNVVYQNYQDATVNTAPPSASGTYYGGAGPSSGGPCCASGYPNGGGGSFGGLARQFYNVLVIVDVRKTGGKSLGLLTDYVTMVALSQPRDLGQCNALPSITDLFAACPGRSAPEGLTPADAAYLDALYPSKGGSGEERAIADRMAKSLAQDKLASR